MKKLIVFLILAATALFSLTGSALPKNGKATQAVSTSAGNGAPKAEKSLADETRALELRRQQLIEKEAALKAKEQELNALSARLDARINELNTAQKAMEASLLAKKKETNERYRKILKIYRGLKAEEAGKLLNKLDDDLVIEMLDQMDQKTAIKLIPYLNQPNVLKWTRENLKGK